MKFEKKFFRSRVAQKLFSLFVFCSLIPIAVVAVISFRHVTGQLYEQSQNRLHQDCKVLGNAIYERLLFLESEMTMVTSGLRSDTEGTHIFSSQSVKTHLTERFKGLIYYGEDGIAHVLFGHVPNRPVLTFGEKQHIFTGKPLVKTQIDNAEVPHIYFFLRADLGGASKIRGTLMGEIDPFYLWYLGYDDALPTLTELCVLDSEQNVIFTSLGPGSIFSQETMQTLSETSSGQFEWSNSDQGFVTSYRDVFMQNQFFVPKWKIVLSVAKTDVMAPMVLFKKTFPFAILLSFWVVLFLSFNQIRRCMIPLERIKEGTRRIAERDFTCRVDVQSKDEFTEVAASFNSMADQLGRQFHTLTTIAHIDQVILSSMETEKIIDTLLSRLRQVFPCDLISVTLIEPAFRDTGKSYISNGLSANQKQVESIKLSHEDIEELKASPKFISKESTGPMPAYLPPLIGCGRASYHILPVFYKQKLAGLISLGFKQPPGLSTEDLKQARQLADQVGVALSNAQLIEELSQFNWGTLKALARAIDAKSPWTAGHSEQSTDFALKIGREMGLNSEDLEILHRGGLLHDIGKLGVPNRILEKRSKLSEQEHAVLRKHASLGARILEPISSYTEVMLIVREHHENYDGSGYPAGLAGEEISIYGRIFAVADRFEALISDRPYRKAVKFDKAVKVIQQGSGKEFDPQVVKAFLKVIGQKEEISSKTQVYTQASTALISSQRN